MYILYIHDEIMVSTSPCSEGPVDKLRTGVDAVYLYIRMRSVCALVQSVCAVEWSTYAMTLILLLLLSFNRFFFTLFSSND